MASTDRRQCTARRSGLVIGQIGGAALGQTSLVKADLQVRMLTKATPIDQLRRMSDPALPSLRTCDRISSG